MKYRICPPRRLSAVCLVLAFTWLLASCSAPVTATPGASLLPNSASATGSPGASLPPTVSPSPAPIAEAALAMKLGKLDIGKDFACSFSAWITEWMGTGANERCHIMFKTGGGGVASNATKLSEGGQDYYSLDSDMPGDYVRLLTWRQDGICYSLTAIVDQEDKKALLDIVSPKLAEKLVNNPKSDIEGYRHFQDHWQAPYSIHIPGESRLVLFNLNLYSSQQAGYLKRLYTDLKETNDGGSVYYAWSKYSEQGNNGCIMWNTDIGVFVVYLSAPADPTLKNLAYANGSLIASINTQLGAAITPFPDPSASPHS